MHAEDQADNYYSCTIPVGEDIESPYNLTTSSGDNYTTFSWKHENPEIVDHYQIILDTNSGITLTLYTDDDMLTIPTVPNYNGTLTAVSVCQRESDSLSFSGI